MNGLSTFSIYSVHTGENKCHGYLPISLREKWGYQTMCITYFCKYVEAYIQMVNNNYFWVGGLWFGFIFLIFTFLFSNKYIWPVGKKNRTVKRILKINILNDFGG